MKLLSFLSLIFLFTSCHFEIKTINNSENIPNSVLYSTGIILSGYQIDEDYFLSQCLNNFPSDFCYSNATSAVIQNINDQLEIGFTTKSSIFAVLKQKNETLMFTAGHSCESINKTNQNIETLMTAFVFPGSGDKPLRIKKFIHVYDLNKTQYNIKEIIYKNQESPDICFLSIEGLFPSTIELSSIQPQLGQKIINISAPHGIFDNQSIIIFDGYYSGQKLNNHIYSIPAAPGSSGSPVLLNNKLIGIIHSTDRRFDHISYGTPLHFIQDIIDLE